MTSPPRFPALGIPAQHLAIIGRGMNEVVNSQAGTAYRARITEPAFAMGGKTGTSQVRRITEEERRVGIRRNDQVPWAHRDHALFVGYAPIQAPRFACACIVEHGGGGSAVAAPIVRDILIETQRTLPEDAPDGALFERLHDLGWAPAFVHDHLSEAYTRTLLSEPVALPALMLQSAEGRLLAQGHWDGALPPQIAAALERAGAGAAAHPAGSAPQ